MTDLLEGWRTATLAEVTTVSKKQDPTETGRAQVRYLEISGIDAATHRVVSADPTSSSSAPSRCRQVLRSGDTVFSTVRPYLERIAYVDDDLDDEFASTGFCVLRPTPVLDPRFLFFFAISPMMLDQVLPMQKGVSYPAVLDKEVRTCAIPVPPLDEQRRIVAILEEHLTHLDAAESVLRQTQVKLDVLEASLLEHVFIETKHPLVSLANVLDGIEAGKSVGSTAGPAQDGEWGVIKVSAMTYGEFRLSENKAIPASLADPKYQIRQGDLLVSRANTEALVGASVMVRHPPNMLLLSDKSLRLRVKPEISTEWLWRVLQAPSTRAQMSSMATGTKDSMRNISQVALRGLLVPSVNQAFQQDALDKYEVVGRSLISERERVDLCRQRASSLSRSLLAAAFRGDLTAGWRAGRRECAGPELSVAPATLDVSDRGGTP